MFCQLRAFGSQCILFLEWPAPTLDTVPVARIATDFCKLMAKYQPKTVFLPFGGDLHEDHKAVYEAVGSVSASHRLCARNGFWRDI